MRILHVSDAYLPKQGGIEVQVHDLARRQLAAGHEVSVLTCAAGAGQGPVPSCGVRVHRRPVPWGRVRRSDAELRRLLRSQRPDVVHAHLSVLSPLAILAVRAAHLERVPVVVTLHSLWWFATPLYWLANLVTGWGRWRVHWTAVSELAARSLRAVVADDDVTVLPNGVEPADWTVTPLPRDPAEVVVVSVMRLAARKRPRALLNVVGTARRHLPPGVRLRVVVVGEGPLQRRLGRRIRRMGLADCVELRGRLERDGIRELYRRADLYLAPAILESFGIAALEARCAGLPVIARRQTGIADFIASGEHGLLAEDDAGLAGALVDLVASPSLRARIADHNRASTPQIGWADVLQRCELAYKTADQLAGTGRPDLDLRRPDLRRPAGTTTDLSGEPAAGLPGELAAADATPPPTER